MSAACPNERRMGSQDPRGGVTPILLATSLLYGVAMTSGCTAGANRAPDLDALYESAAARPHTPVIVIPGVLGSRLRQRTTGREVWPGGLLDLITGRRFRDLEVPESGAADDPDSLAVGGLFFEAFGEDHYGEILRTLEGPGGYRCVPSDAITNDADCVVMAWDWRLDFVDAAARLEQVVNEIRELRGDPRQKVDIVAHSAGGLVARYYLRFGGRDVLDRETIDEEQVVGRTGDAAVRRAILIGTPNYGSVTALQMAMRGADTGPGLATIPPEVLATMPGLFEILPNPARTWMIDIHGQRVDLDLFDLRTWRDHEWSIFDPAIRRRILDSAASASQGEADLRMREAKFRHGLERGRRFHRALSAPLKETSTQYVAVGGDCDLTPSRCLLETVGGRTMVRLTPGEIRHPLPGVNYSKLMLEPGDGRVTKASLLARESLDPASTQPGFFPLAYVILICRGHSELPSDVTFRDNLLNILLY